MAEKKVPFPVVAILIVTMSFLFGEWILARNDAEFWHDQANKRADVIHEWKGINDTWKRVNQNNEATISNYKQALERCYGR